MVTQITAIVSAIIASVSLYVSIRVYRRDTPKIHIEISDPKYDCLFGKVALNFKEGLRFRRISCAKITLRNASSASIEVQSVTLKIKKDSFRLIPKDISCWNEVTFMNSDDDVKNINPNNYIPYEERGVQVPCVIDGFHSLEGYVLFYSFPDYIKEKIRAQLIVKTAVGVVSKKVKLLEYNNTFENQEMEEIKQYYKSLGEKE